MIAILIVLSVTTNIQTKCGIIYEKIMIWAGDDEQMINYEGPNLNLSMHFRVGSRSPCTLKMKL